MSICSLYGLVLSHCVRSFHKCNTIGAVAVKQGYWLEFNFQYIQFKNQSCSMNIEVLHIHSIN